MKTFIQSKQACTMTAYDTAKFFDVDVMHGLETRVIVERRMLFGVNDVKHKRLKISHITNEIIAFWEQLKDPCILLLIALAVGHLGMKQTEDAINIMVAIVIVTIVIFIEDRKSEQLFEDLNQLMPSECNCLRYGRIEKILTVELVPGDIVFLESGDRVPADMRLFEAEDLMIDESWFTGDNCRSRKTTEPLKRDEDIAFPGRKCIAFMGTAVSSGKGAGIVISTGANTEFGEILRMLDSPSEKEDMSNTPLQNDIDLSVKVLAKCFLATIGVIMFLVMLQGKQLIDIFTLGVSLAVTVNLDNINFSVAVASAMSVLKLAEKKVVVKTLPVMEKLGRCDVICVGKSGTLTLNQKMVTAIYSSDNAYAEVTGSGYSVKGDVMCNGLRVDRNTHPSISKVIEVGCICNNADIHGGFFYGPLIDKALLVAAVKMNLQQSKRLYVRLEQTSSNSEDKYMAIRCNPVFGQSQENIYFVKGALQYLLSHSIRYYCGETTRILTDKERDAYNAVASKMATSGLEVLAMGYGEDINSLIFVGMVGISDPLQPKAKESIKLLKEEGVDLKMWTESSELTAKFIANQIGLSTFGESTLSGKEVEETDDQHLKQIVCNVSVFHGITPRGKVKITDVLQMKQRVVGVIGHGAHDTVSLKRADIGIHMGKSGTDVSREAADIIVMNDDLSAVKEAIGEGKRLFVTVEKFLKFQFSTSVALLMFVFLSVVTHFPFPFNAMQILWIKLLISGPLIFKFGSDSNKAYNIRKPERRANGPIITRSFVTASIVSVIVVTVGTIFVLWRETTIAREQTTHREADSTTMVFTCFVYFGIFNAISCVFRNRTWFGKKCFSNRPFIRTILGLFIGQMLIVYCPPLQVIFKTEQLCMADQVFLVAIAATVMLVPELGRTFTVFSRKTE